MTMCNIIAIIAGYSTGSVAVLITYIMAHDVYFLALGILMIGCYKYMLGAKACHIKSLELHEKLAQERMEFQSFLKKHDDEKLKHRQAIKLRIRERVLQAEQDKLVLARIESLLENLRERRHSKQKQEDIAALCMQQAVRGWRKRVSAKRTREAMAATVLQQWIRRQINKT
jgi:hypothetical protein